MLQEVTRMCAQEITAKRIKLLLQFDARVHHAWADPVRIRQVFWNIISNAVKFTPTDGRVTITTATADDDKRLVVAVSDTGVAFEPADAERIFSPFEQGEKTVTRCFGGLGVGLTISRSIVAIRKCNITARSEGPGQGATFTISVPAIPADDGGHKAPAGKPARRDHSSRILLVEDHEDTLALLSRLLARCGYKVTTANSVNAAIRQLEESRFDIVVSDIGLPDGSGCDILPKGVPDSLAGKSKESPSAGSAARKTSHAAKPPDFSGISPSPLISSNCKRRSMKSSLAQRHRRVQHRRHDYSTDEL
jgi:hypothetical protein